MPHVHFIFDEVKSFAKAMREAAPKHLIRATGKALFRIGKLDTAAMQEKLRSGTNLKVKAKGLLKSFKFNATDSRKVRSIGEMKLSEYTGAKLMGIFQTGGVISGKARTLTILTGAARTASGKRKYTQKELKAMIDSGQAKVIQSKAGPMVIKVENQFTKTGKIKRGAKSTVLAFLRPKVVEKKRIDFYENFEEHNSQHIAILEAAAQEAIEATERDEGAE